MKRLNLFLDDLRPTPEGFDRVYTVKECINKIKEFNNNKIGIGILSLDNDLGKNQKEGRKVVDFIELEFINNPNFILPEFIIVHSSNAVAKQYMSQIIERIYGHDMSDYRYQNINNPWSLHNNK